MGKLGEFAPGVIDRLYTDGPALLSPYVRVTAILGHDTLDLTPANARR